MSVTTKVLPDAPALINDPDKEKSKPKKSRKKLLIVVAVLVVVLGVGGFLGKGMLLGPSGPEVDPTKVVGTVKALAPITLNLADGRYLKLTMALQLSEAGSPVHGSVDEAAGAVVGLDGAKALDAANSVLGQLTYRELLAPGGRARAQRALSARVKKLYPGEVMGVYFTEFLMQ
ncbi:MAG: flagellar protein FliL [Actinomycetota bacterium]|nr:flagellar protein FliL [Actinomycetota bacterium]